MIKTIHNPFPPAPSMRATADQIQDSKCAREKYSIRREIIQASYSGEYSIIREGKLSPEVRAMLRDACYDITYSPDGEGYCISWRNEQR